MHPASSTGLRVGHDLGETDEWISMAGTQPTFSGTSSRTTSDTDHAGHIHDADINLVYMNARYNALAMGRF